MLRGDEVKKGAVVAVAGVTGVVLAVVVLLAAVGVGIVGVGGGAVAWFLMSSPVDDTQIYFGSAVDQAEIELVEVVDEVPVEVVDEGTDEVVDDEVAEEVARTARSRVVRTPPAPRGPDDAGSWQRSTPEGELPEEELDDIDMAADIDVLLEDFDLSAYDDDIVIIEDEEDKPRRSSRRSKRNKED